MDQLRRSFALALNEDDRRPGVAPWALLLGDATRVAEGGGGGGGFPADGDKLAQNA